MSKDFLPHTLDVNGTAINCKISESFSRNTEVSAPLADGDIMPTHQAITNQKSMYDVETYNIPAAIGLTGVLGALISGTVQWYDAEMDSAGGKKSGSDHVSGSFAAAYVYPLSISVTSKQVAVMRFRIVGLSTNDSASFSSGASLSGTPGTTVQFGMGPLEINGTTTTQIQNFNLDFGIQLRDNVTDGNIGVDDTKLESARPVATFTSTDANLQATVGSVTELVELSDGLQFYLRSYNNRTGGYASGGGVLVEMDLGLLLHTQTSGRNRASNYRAEGAAGSTNAVVVSTGVAIP